MRRTIYVKNEKVNEIFDNSNNVSGLVEESVLFYIKNKEGKMLTEEQVRELFCDLTKAWLELMQK